MARIATLAAIVGVVGASGGAPGAEASPTIGAPADTGSVGQAVLVELPAIEILAPGDSEAGSVPLFRWEPFDAAVTYQLTVLGAEGPLWAWQGEATEVYLGGLPFERPPGWAGPTLDTAACLSVRARDAEGDVIAASAMLPLSPGPALGHTCLPGTGIVWQ